MTDTPETSSEFAALLAHQRTIAEKVAKIAALNAKIAETEHVASKLDASLPDLEAMQDERKTILADIAIGERSESDLEAIDSRINATSESAYPACMDLGRARETVAGLQSKVETETAALRDLEEKRPILRRRFLLAEAEAAGAEYALAAVTAVAYYKRLTALGSLLSEHGVVPNIHAQTLHLHVPSFGLESVRPYAAQHRPAVIYERPHLNHEPMAWRASEIDRLRDAGVEF